MAEWSVADRQMRYGANEMRIPVKSVGRLVFDEMWHPFYVFQVGATWRCAWVRPATRSRGRACAHIEVLA